MKRAFDLVSSLLGLVILAPVMMALAICIKIESSGPVFYRGWRTGQHDRPFRIFKFRSMVPNAEKLGGPSTANHDPRLTRLGRVLRKYKLDELPQILNVIRGEMSLVGPRPEVPQYTNMYSEEEKIILSVRPGITDYASLRFINLDAILGDTDVDRLYIERIRPEKNRLRIQYVQEQSFSGDLRILLQTMSGLIFRRGQEQSPPRS